MNEELEIAATLSPMHPGEVLREEFMEPLGLTAGKIAKAIQVPRNRIEQIARGRLGISGDTALRLGRFFGTTPDLWMSLQKDYELRMAREADGRAIDAIEPRAA